MFGWKKQLERAKAWRWTSERAEEARAVCEWSSDPPCPPRLARWGVHAPVWRLCGSGWVVRVMGDVGERLPVESVEGSAGRSQRRGWDNDAGLAVV